MQDEGPLCFSDVHDLEECINGCSYIDNARRIISADPLFADPLRACNEAVQKLSWGYGFSEKMTIDAMLICHCFMSKKPSDQHIVSAMPSRAFWSFVGVVCFTLTMKFQLPTHPKLSEMFEIIGIRECDSSVKYYKNLQIHILTVIKWKLLFPTGVLGGDMGLFSPF